MRNRERTREIEERESCRKRERKTQPPATAPMMSKMMFSLSLPSLIKSISVFDFAVVWW
ncbi:hypothetical protein Hanom_Chr00s000002g01599511 [Helianthus anomalus]